MEKPASPAFPLVLITNEQLQRKAEVVFEHEVQPFFFDEPFASEELWWIVDAEGRRVGVHEHPDRLEVFDRGGGSVPCGFCFERTFTPPRYPPRCDACAAENLCWSCREREAVPGPFSPAAPLPRCHDCRDVTEDWVALPPQPRMKISDRVVPMIWAVTLGAAVNIAIRACGR